MNRRKTDTDLANRMTNGLQNALLIHNPNAGRGGAKRHRSLDEARRMKPGPERTEAMKRAGILRNAVDLQGLSFARRGRPAKT